MTVDNPVAPFAGAWIETIGCVLVPATVLWVAPFAGAWIETTALAELVDEHLRRSLRGSVDRNHLRRDDGAGSIGSLPSRERGSKPSTLRRPACGSVAPFAGAWIETFGAPLRQGCGGRSLRGSVDRNSVTRWHGDQRRRRSLRGSVDRNHITSGTASGTPSRSLRGSVDRKPITAIVCRAGARSLPSRERGSKLRNRAMRDRGR